MDLQPLTNLNNEALAPEHLKKMLEKRGEAAELRAAQDFEAVFIQTSLKEMRPKPSKDGLFGDGQKTEVFYQFMDEAIAKEISRSPNNFGIQDHILRQHF